MASVPGTIELKPSAELSAALDEARALDAAASQPFDYDTLQPLVLQSAKLISEYYYALIESKVPATLVDNIVYDFHRVLWSVPGNSE